MRPFTDEEFEKMIFELTDESHPSFEMLCTIADKTLRSKVRFWCATDSILSGRGLEDDIMQEVFIKLIKTTVTHFLIRKDCNGQVNRNPDGFKSWMFTVAKNIKNDTANALRNRDFRTRNLEESENNQISDTLTVEDEIESCRREKLAKAFGIVFDSDKKVYIILTWLAQNLFVLEYDISKIKSIRFMEMALSEKTLFEMRDIVLNFAKKIEWISISNEQLERIDEALNSIYKDGLLGNCRYKELFMKKGGRESISDWINRVNRMIERLM